METFRLGDNMVDFRVNPLGGFNPGQALQQLGQQFGDQKRADAEQDELKAQRSQLQSAIKGAAGGDPESMGKLYELKPELAIHFQKQSERKIKEFGVEQYAKSKDAEIDWGVRWTKAKTPEEKELLVKEAEGNPLIDIDETDLNVNETESNIGVRNMLYQHMGKDAYEQFYGEKEKPLTLAEKEGFKVKRESIQQRRDVLVQKAKLGKGIGAKDRRAINKDFTTLISDSVDTYKAAKSLSKLNEKSTPTDQLAAIFKFMKSLDPTSVVREGEQQLAKRTGGPVDAFVGWINQLQGEGGLTPTAFRNMVNTAIALSDSATESAQTEAGAYLDSYEDTLPQKYKELLRKRLPPMIGAGGEKSKGAKTAKTPDVGFVSRGYKFIGGDPSKKESWRKQ